MSRLLLVKSLVLVLLSLVVLSGCGGSGGEDSEHDLVPAPETNVTDTNTTPDTNGTQPDDSNGTTGGGSDDGNTTGGGNDTNTTAPTVRLSALKLTLGATTLNKDHNTTLTLTATYSDHTTKPLTSGITWIITPSDAVTLHGTTLTARKDVNVTVQAKVGTTLSNTVHLSIYWEVNGHRLPPEPDPAVNNATLLGIDSNHNGVRDDVERKVYATYKKAVERAVMMQAFKTEQAMLADPDLIKNAREWEKKIWKAINCNDYLSTNRNIKPMSRQDVKNTTEWQINTEQRVKKYYKYDQALSGGVYSISDGTLQDCEFDVEKVLEMDR